MLQFENDTPFQGTILLLPDPDGVDSLFTVVKGTFTLADRPLPAEEQIPIVLADEYYGEPGASSVKVPSDVSLTKPATDVLLVGRAHAPGGRPAAVMDVSLAVGPLGKTVRVFGDRFWRSDGVGLYMTEPQPFQTMPLVWERAYGGMDRAGPELRAEVRNPVGRGYRAADGERQLDGLPLPNLEDPTEPITSWKQSPAPACFAPVCAHWQPRQSYAGTYDEDWQRQRAPYLPTDFDPRFFQLAPPGLVAPGHLQGGEPVEVRGATPSGVLKFQLPMVDLRITYVLDGDPIVQPANLDTVIIEPDEDRLILAWRAVLQCDKRALRVSEVRAALLEAA